MDAVRERIIEKLARLREREERDREEQGWLRDPDHDGHWIPPGWARAAQAS